MIITYPKRKALDLFRDWVPKWLEVPLGLIILFPVLLINGAYMGSNVDISGFLGVLSEDINMAYYASSVGMTIAYLVIPKTKPLITAKTVLLISLLSQVALSLICARTVYIEVITVCSFLIGYFKAFALIEIIGIIMVPFSPSGTRNEFYAKFYPLTLVCGQLSLVLTAELAYIYNWQYMYYFMILLLLVAIIVVVTSMKFAKIPDTKVIIEIDWISLFLISLCFMSIIYVATYGKTNDWFTSEKIVFASILIPITGWMFIRRQFVEKPALDLHVLKNRNSLTVYILSFPLMFFSSSTILVSAYTTNVLRLSSTRVNELYLYMIPGFVVGGFICYYFYRKEIRMAWLIFLGFSCFTLSIAILYFRVSSAGLYNDLFIQMFLRGMGLVCLFVAFAIYAVYGLQPKQMLHNSFFFIGSRAALAPAIGTSILSNWFYSRQQKSLSVLSEGIDMQNLTAASQFTSSVKTAMAQGWSIEDAQRLGISPIYQQVQIQAVTVSIKNIAGWMLIIGIILLIGIVLYFLQFKPVRLIKVGGDMTGHDF